MNPDAKVNVQEQEDDGQKQETAYVKKKGHGQSKKDGTTKNKRKVSQAVKRQLWGRL